MAEKLSRTSGRINIEMDLRELYEELARGTDPRQTPFRTMKDVFMLAACIGFEKRQRRPLAGAKHQPFHYTQLSDQIDIPILKAMAIVETQDVQILGDLDGIVTIAEEYANVGIHDIKMYVVDPNGEPLWNLVEAIR